MSFIVEFELSTPILRETATAASKLTIEQVYRSERGATKLVFWAYGDDLEALQSYRESCRKRELPFRLRRIFQEHESEPSRYGVSERQREALLAALEAGYFDVPRDATLAGIAEGLGISDQALSARLRRGQATLLRNTIAMDDPT